VYSTQASLNPIKQHIYLLNFLLWGPTPILLFIYVKHINNKL
jgi:hypothetical protein